MLIREIFATRIEERIDPVVKVADRTPTILYNELNNLIVTPQWEQHLHRFLEEYADAFEREDEQDVGIWISGFFGSGKSLLMKVLGLLLEGGELQGQPVHELFLGRLPASGTRRSDLQRFLKVCENKIVTTFIGGNLHAMQAASDDALQLITFRMFAEKLGYTNNWPFAWAVEYQLDAQGLTAAFRQKASELSGMAWERLAQDAAFYNETLYQAVMEVLSGHFSSIEAIDRAVNMAYQQGITPNDLIVRLRDWCIRHDRAGRRQKLLLQFDELGQWIRSGSNTNERMMRVQALIEEASRLGGGRIWMAVTAHGDVQEYRAQVQQAVFEQINQRFGLKCRLSNEDINTVVQERLLRKTQAAGNLLRERFQQHSGDLIDLATLQARRSYGPAPDAESIMQFYPYLPWTVSVVPEIVKSIAHAIGRDDALSGSNRTLIGVVQGGILETPGILGGQVGKLISLADLYNQLSGDTPFETRTDLNSILDSVPGASHLTVKVARALYLLGQVEHVDCTLDNVNRALADALDYQFGAERGRVKEELDRLVEAGYVKQVGNNYTFLTTQQRSFQDRVRSRQRELLGAAYELSQKLRDYDNDDAFRFDRVALSGMQGREKLVRLEIDGRMLPRNKDEAVVVRVYSPIQRIIDPGVADDATMKQRSMQEPNNIFFRMGYEPDLRQLLALALATEEMAERILSGSEGLVSGPEREIANKARQQDLSIYKQDIRGLLASSVRTGTIFWNGTEYQLMYGESASGRVRNTLGQILANIYSRFRDVPQRIENDEAAVKAALTDNTAHSDLQKLGVYRADGTLNESHPLLSALRGSLPQAEQDEGFISAEQLRTKFARPPYGWDGNCIKVGLALLLRAGACKLIENSRSITDPSSPDALRLLSKEQSFRNLRVQGARIDLKIEELQAARNYMEMVFQERPPVVAATLNSKLGEQLNLLQAQARNMDNWAKTARCPLPLAFESGSSLVAEMLGNTTPAARLKQFLGNWETLGDYAQLLQELERYQREHGAAYGMVLDFFNSMVNAQVNAEAVRRFINDWRTVTQVERNVTDSARWSEIMAVYHAAQQAVTDEIAKLRQQVEQDLNELEVSLPDRVRSAGVPAGQAGEEIAKLSAELQPVRSELEQARPNLGEAREMERQFAAAKFEVLSRLQRLGNRYQARVSVPALTAEPAPASTKHEIRDGAASRFQVRALTWQEVLGTVRVSSANEVESIVQRLRQRILEELEQGHDVEIG